MFRLNKNLVAYCNLRLGLLLKNILLLNYCIAIVKGCVSRFIGLFILGDVLLFLLFTLEHLLVFEWIKITCIFNFLFGDWFWFW